MAVIITDMDMPKRCVECPMHENSNDYCKFRHDFSCFVRAKNACPLKSADEMIKEIEPKCDRINSLASVLPYTAHREIQELLCEIMDLCKAESEGT